MYYDLVESGKRIKALRKEHGLTQEALSVSLAMEQLKKRSPKHKAKRAKE